MVNLWFRYFQCIHQRLYHLTPNDYEDFVSVIVHAKRAFNWLIEGPNAFQQLLSSIKRSVDSRPSRKQTHRYVFLLEFFLNDIFLMPVVHGGGVRVYLTGKGL